MTAGLVLRTSLRAQRSNPEPREDWIASSATLLAMTDKASTAVSSQKALRIDVDLDLEIAPGFGGGGEPFAQIVRQIDGAQRFHQQAETIAALDHGERGFGGSQHLDPRVDRRDSSQLSRKALRRGPVAGGNDQAR